MSGEGTGWWRASYRSRSCDGESSRNVVQQLQQGTGVFSGQLRAVTASETVSGTLLVVGSAPCLFEDLEQAQKLRPTAKIVLVNGACTAIEDADYVLAGHEEKAPFFARERNKTFPFALPWELWAAGPLHRPNFMKTHRQMFPEVTHWFPYESGAGATSATKAAKIGLLYRGFAEIILCGCPLDQPGYFPAEAKVPQHVACARIGDHGRSKHFTTPEHKPGEYTTKVGELMKIQEMKIIRGYRENFKKFAIEFKNRVFSMSGFTREQLGSPPEV